MPFGFTEFEAVSLEQTTGCESPQQSMQLLECIGDSWHAMEQGYHHDRPAPSAQFPAANLIDTW